MKIPHISEKEYVAQMEHDSAQNFTAQVEVMTPPIESDLFTIAYKMGERSNKCYAIINTKYEIIHINEYLLNLTGFSRDYMMHMHYIKLLEKTKEKNELNSIEQKIADGKVFTINFVHKRKTGPSFYAEIECIPFTNEHDQTECVLLFIRDVTYKQLYGFMARIERDMFNAIQEGRSFIEKLEMICDGIDTMFFQKSLTSIVFKEDNQLSIIHSQNYMNKESILLTNDREILFYENVMNGMEVLVYDYISSLPLYKQQKEMAIDMKMNCIALIPITLHGEQPLGLISIIFDEQYINEHEYYQFFDKLVHLIGLAYAYELKQQEIYELAYFDKYINIPNRHGFINEVMKKKLHFNQQLILIIEPGNFSKIVELYGRDAGDELLKQIYERFTNHFARSQPLIGRLSSSSLIVKLVFREFDRDELEGKIKNLTHEPFEIAGKKMYVPLKCGVSFKVKSNLEDTVRQAERALAEAKIHAGLYVSYYTPFNDQQLEREVEILNHLIDALKTKAFDVYFQPKIELHRGRIVGVEALSRWQCSHLGFVSPMEFIPIAERAGIIHDIDLQIFEKVLQWLQRRQYEGKNVVPVAINISPDHFYHPNFIENLMQLIQQYYADPALITIEITESIGLVDLQKAREILRKLANIGFKTSIDDFGIGYSSLSYLHKLNVSELKIDRSFTMKLDQIGTRAIVKSIIDIAKQLHLNVVTEGVETQQQEQLLKELGCYAVQGYYYYKPMSIEQLEQCVII